MFFKGVISLMLIISNLDDSKKIKKTPQRKKSKPLKNYHPEITIATILVNFHPFLVFFSKCIYNFFNGFILNKLLSNLFL